MGESHSKLPITNDEFSWIQPAKQDLYSRGYIIRIFIGILIYLVVSAILCVICIQIDFWIPINLGDNIFGNSYAALTFRQDIELGEWSPQWIQNHSVNHTRHFSMGNLIYYILQSIFGFTFVNIITINNARVDPFFSIREEYSIWNPYNKIYAKYHQNLIKKYDTSSGHNYQLEKYLDFHKCVGLTFFAYFVTGQIILRNPYSIELKEENAQILSFGEIFYQNFFIWTLSYYAGLQFTHLDFLQGADAFTLDTNSDKSWPWWGFALLYVLGFGAISLIFFLSYLWFLSGYFVIAVYLSWITLISFIIGLFTWIYSKGGIHVHHYAWSLGVVTICGHHNVIATSICGICHGIFVEGCSRWSMDPLWNMEPLFFNDTFAAFYYRIYPAEKKVQSKMIIFEI